MTTNIISQTVATPKILYQGQLPGTVGTLATVPAGSTWTIMSCVVTCVSGANDITMEVVPSGQTAGVTHRIVNGIRVSFQDTLILTDVFKDMQLSAGDFIAGFASSASSATVTITGIEGS